MATPLEPGVFTKLFAELAVQAEAKATAAITAAAVLVQERAIQSVSARTHTRRSKTPARPGGPPAMVSGTLAKSITHSTAVSESGGIQIKVGMSSALTAPYSKTRASLVAKYLEIDGAGKSRVKYPFLGPAFEQTAHAAMETTFRAVFSTGWVGL